MALCREKRIGDPEKAHARALKVKKNREEAPDDICLGGFMDESDSTTEDQNPELPF